MLVSDSATKTPDIAAGGDGQTTGKRSRLTRRAGLWVSLRRWKKVPFRELRPDEPDAPSNAEKKAAEDADVAQQRWKNLMFNTHRSAQHAWDSGRTHHVLVTRLEYAGRISTRRCRGQCFRS